MFGKVLRKHKKHGEEEAEHDSDIPTFLIYLHVRWLQAGDK